MLCILFVSMFFFLPFSFGGIIILNSHAASGPGYITGQEVSPDCKLEMNAEVYLANLVQGHHNIPNALPEGAEDIYLEVSANNYYAVIYLDPDDFVRTTLGDDFNENGERIFSYRPRFRIDVDNECHGGPSSKTINFRFLRSDGSPYPCVDYGAAGDLFSCTYFRPNCSQCLNPLPDCEPNTNAEFLWHQSYGLDCTYCLLGAYVGPGDYLFEVGGERIGDSFNEENSKSANINNTYEPDSFEKNYTQFSLKDNLDFNIYPNPFTSTLNLDLNLSNIEDFEITIYRANGEKILKSKSIKDTQNLILETNDWERGIYFVQIHSKEYSEIKKVVKL